MATLFLGGKLIFKMNRGRSCFDHLFCKLKDIQSSTETRLSISNYGHVPVRGIFSLGSVDLVRSFECLVYASYEDRHAVARIQALVRVRISCKICIRSYLPAAHVDRL